MKLANYGSRWPPDTFFVLRICDTATHGTRNGGERASLHSEGEGLPHVATTRDLAALFGLNEFFLFELLL